MFKTYPAIFHKESVGYWVEFPGFSGGTQGDTLDDAMLEAKEMLASVIAFYIDEGMELPKPMNIRSIQVDNEEDFTTMIQVDPTPYIKGNKTIRKNVTVPEWLVKRAEQSHVNFSEILTEALYEKLYN